jgi:hypothetical protein
VLASAWAQYASPAAAAGKLVGTPVFIRHDEADSPPIRESVAFVSRAKAAGADVTLERVRGGFHGFYQDPMAEKRSLFEFFRGKERATASQEAAVSNVAARFGAGRGPIENAFGGPILVVEGTLGTPVQRASVHALTESIRSEWREAFFVECPVKPDSEVAAADIRDSSLIVVGDTQTNSLIKRMGDRLPVKVAPNLVSLAGKRYEGDHLGYWSISPNPLNPEKYVVVIGMNQWADPGTWQVHPSRDGICDYFVFDLQGGEPVIRDAGYFGDEIWNQTKGGSARSGR